MCERGGEHFIFLGQRLQALSATRVAIFLHLNSLQKQPCCDHPGASKSKKLNGSWFGLANGFCFVSTLDTFEQWDKENKGGESPLFSCNLLANSAGWWKN